MRARTGSRVGLGVAFAGAVAAHALTYLILLPARSTRDQMLVDSGHAYWQTATLAAIGVGAFACALIFLRGSRGQGRQPFLRLAGAQVSIFAIVETLERLASGAPLGTLGRVLPLGIAMQVLVAAIGSLATATIVLASLALSRAIPLTEVGIATTTVACAIAEPADRRDRLPPPPRSARAPPASPM